MPGRTRPTCRPGKYRITDLEFAYGEYETYQVPITQIESMTSLDFGTLREHDPIQGLEASVFRVEGPDSL